MRHRSPGVRLPLLLAFAVVVWICLNGVFLRRGGISFSEDGAVRAEHLEERIYPEHIKGMADVRRLVALKDVWVPQTLSQPYIDEERYVPCDTRRATSQNAKGVDLARAALGHPTAFPPNLESAKRKFRAAMDADRTCLAPLLNLVMLLLAEAVALETPEAVGTQRLQELELVFNRLPDVEGKTPLHAKYHWWRCMHQEILVNGTNEHTKDLYDKATLMSPFLMVEHVHPERAGGNSVLSPIVREADYYSRRGLVQFQMYYEFMPAVGGYPAVTYEDAHRFARDWHIAVDNALPPYCFAVASRMYRYLVDENMLGWNGQGYRGAATHESLSDPLNSWVDIQVTKFVAKLANIKVVPTYGYHAGYIKGDYLKPHTDRNACEFTLTTLLSAYPHVSSCPLFVQRTPWQVTKDWTGRFEDQTVYYNDSVNLHPQLNQWLVIRGRAKPHFRPALPKHTTCSTLLAHYIPSDLD